MNKNIILYGAGFCGAMFLELLQAEGERPQCFFDQKKAGSLEGIPIRKPCKIAEMTDASIVVCMLEKGSLYEEIRNNLKNLGYEDIVHIYDLKDKKLFEDQKVIILPKKEIVEGKMEHFKTMCERLKDKTSKKLLDQVVDSILDQKIAVEKNAPIQEQYLAYDIFTHNEEEVFVDCGAFKGEVLEAFIEKNKKFKRYICIEADEKYLPFLEQKKKQYDCVQIEIKKAALSDQVEEKFIKNYAMEDSILSEKGDRRVDTVPLDQLMQDEEITFLKIDVEGMEKKVLEGAKNEIIKNRPIIAVATYHYETEFYELFEWIENLDLQYDFFLRSYMNIQEIVLYAVPKERWVKNIQ